MIHLENKACFKTLTSVFRYEKYRQRTANALVHAFLPWIHLGHLQVTQNFFGYLGSAVAAGCAGVFVAGSTYYMRQRFVRNLHTKIFQKTPGNDVIDDARKFYGLDKKAKSKDFDKKYLEEKMKPCVGLKREENYEIYSAYRTIIEANDKQKRSGKYVIQEC